MRRFGVLLAVGLLMWACGGEDDGGTTDWRQDPVANGNGRGDIAPNGNGQGDIVPNGNGQGDIVPNGNGRGDIAPNGNGQGDIAPNGNGDFDDGNAAAPGGDNGGGNNGGGNNGGGNNGGGGNDCAAACQKLADCGAVVPGCVQQCAGTDQGTIDCVINTPCNGLATCFPQGG